MKSVTLDELIRVEIELLDLKAEKSAMAIKVNFTFNNYYYWGDSVFVFVLKQNNFYSKLIAVFTFVLQLRSLEAEKKQALKDLEELYKRQKEEMEIQQLQHFQVIRYIL